ncbi:hypothetical protein TA3x_005811 (plasmid) [Tundrisphaera sp. TA3]|uniref:hypothetical protein n=1 Tax=Tundrisphaera sp. TA3 TaxID=3435775 RepID=UPI003EB9356D
MEDEARWWLKFNACEATCRTFLEETCSEGRPERMEALDAMLRQLRVKLLEESQAEVRAWRRKTVGEFSQRFRPVAALVEKVLSRLASVSEWEAAGLRVRLNAGDSRPRGWADER